MKRLAIIAAAGLAMAAAANPVAQWFHFDDAAIAPVDMPPVTDGLLAWYKFDSDALDYSGNNRHGSEVAGPGIRYADGGIILDGKGRVVLPAMYPDTGWGSVVYRAIKHEDPSGTASSFYMVGTSVVTSVSTGYRMGNIITRGIRGNLEEWGLGVAAPTNTAINFAATWTNNNARAYTNGIQYGIDTICTVTNLPQGTHWIGSGLSGAGAAMASRTNTVVFEFLIYSRPISSNEQFLLHEWLTR